MKPRVGFLKEFLKLATSELDSQRKNRYQKQIINKREDIITNI